MQYIDDDDSDDKSDNYDNNYYYDGDNYSIMYNSNRIKRGQIDVRTCKLKVIDTAFHRRINVFKITYKTESCDVSSSSSTSNTSSSSSSSSTIDNSSSTLIVSTNDEVVSLTSTTMKKHVMYFSSVDEETMNYWLISFYDAIKHAEEVKTTSMQLPSPALTSPVVAVASASSSSSSSLSMPSTSASIPSSTVSDNKLSMAASSLQPLSPSSSEGPGTASHTSSPHRSGLHDVLIDGNKTRKINSTITATINGDKGNININDSSSSSGSNKGDNTSVDIASDRRGSIAGAKSALLNMLNRRNNMNNNNNSMDDNEVVVAEDKNGASNDDKNYSRDNKKDSDSGGSKVVDGHHHVPNEPSPNIIIDNNSNKSSGIVSDTTIHETSLPMIAHTSTSMPISSSSLPSSTSPPSSSILPSTIPASASSSIPVVKTNPRDVLMSKLKLSLLKVAYPAKKLARRIKVWYSSSGFSLSSDEEISMFIQELRRSGDQV